MRHVLALLFLAHGVFCDPTTTATPADIITAPPTTESTENSTKTVNKTDMERIIQPSSSQRQIKLKLPPPALNASAKTDDSKPDFKPSPQLELYYEFNRFPVPPAHPEPKFFSSVVKVPIEPLIDKPRQHYQRPNQYEHNSNQDTIRFPHTHPQTSKEHPYPFLTKDTDRSPSLFYGGYKKPAMSKPYEHHHEATQSSYLPSYSDNWDKTLNKRPSKPIYGPEHGTHMMQSPWKKIIKLLTAFIPIGLLISALTPSVITISPMNGTYGKATRMDDSKGKPLGISLLSQLKNDGCDERILCELLLNAEESGQSDGAIENLLDNYMNGKGDTMKLDRIYKAIKNGNCSSLSCNSIKHN